MARCPGDWPGDRRASAWPRSLVETPGRAEEAASDSRAPVKFDLASPEGHPPPPGGRPSRRTLLAAAAGAMTAALPRPARASGDKSNLEFARLVLPGLPAPRPSALRRLAWEVVRRTSIVTSSETPELHPGDPALFRPPFLVVVYSQIDLDGAWARDGFGHWEHEGIPGGDAQREDAFRFGVNLVMYALCLDYKTEQAHIDYILR